MLSDSSTEVTEHVARTDTYGLFFVLDLSYVKRDTTEVSSNDNNMFFVLLFRHEKAWRFFYVADNSVEPGS